MFCLIVSDSPTRTGVFTALLQQAYAEGQVVQAASGARGRRLLLTRDFLQVIIDAPLVDENGESLARHVRRKGITPVILCVPYAHYDEVSALYEDEGILVVAKPFSPRGMWTAIKLAAAVQHKENTRENTQMAQKLQDIRLLDRAKRALMNYGNMTEQQAHRHIEKKAMDARATKRTIAQEVIAQYEHPLR